MSFGGFKLGNTSAPAPTTGGGLFGNMGQSQQPQQQPAAAGGSSLFGNFGAKAATPAPSTGGGLFGSTSTTQPGQQQGQQPASSGGLFGSTSQPQQQQPGGLFGSTTSQPAQSSGLFGSTSQPQQQQSGGLFGSTASQPAQSGGLFGSTAQKPANTGLFGSTSQQPGTSMFGSQAPQQNQSTGLFGSSTQPAQQTSTGLFGSAQPAQQSSGTTMFGSTTQATQQPGTSLFGQSSAQPGGSGLFGQTGQSAQTQQQLQTSSNPQGSTGGIEKTTKFSDLPEAAQRYIEQLDNAIKSQKSIVSDLQTDSLGRAIWQTSLDLKSANEEYGAISHTLKSLKNSISQLREKMIDQSRDVERIKEIWDIYSSGEGRMGQIRLGAHKDFPQEFFTKVADQLEDKVARYKKAIAQLHRVITSLSSETQSSTPQAIAQTINNHQQAILALAAQLDQLQVRLNGLKVEFVAEWRDSTGSVRDPFEMAREEMSVKM